MRFHHKPPSGPQPPLKRQNGRILYDRPSDTVAKQAIYTYKVQSDANSACEIHCALAKCPAEWQSALCALAGSALPPGPVLYREWWMGQGAIFSRTLRTERTAPSYFNAVGYIKNTQDESLRPHWTPTLSLICGTCTAANVGCKDLWSYR